MDCGLEEQRRKQSSHGHDDEELGLPSVEERPKGVLARLEIVGVTGGRGVPEEEEKRKRTRRQMEREAVEAEFSFDPRPFPS